MHEPEFENPYNEVPFWKGALATCLFFFVFVAIPIVLNVLPLAEDTAPTTRIEDAENLFTPASSTRPRRSLRNTNNLDCPTDTA